MLSISLGPYRKDKLDPKSNRIYISRNGLFYETPFPFRTTDKTCAKFDFHNDSEGNSTLTLLYRSCSPLSLMKLWQVLHITQLLVTLLRLLERTLLVCHLLMMLFHTLQACPLSYTSLINKAILQKVIQWSLDRKMELVEKERDWRLLPLNSNQLHKSPQPFIKHRLQGKGNGGRV